MNLSLHFTSHSFPQVFKRCIRDLCFFSFFFFFTIPQAHAMYMHDGITKPFLVVPCFITQGGVIIIQAKLSTFPDTLNFVLDTGSGGASLDSTICVRFSLIRNSSGDSVVGIGGKKPAVYVHSAALNIQTLVIDNIRFHVNNYDFLSENLGLKIAGILGKTLLQRFIVEINYDTRMVKFYHTYDFTYPEKGSLLTMDNLFLPTLDLSLKEQVSVTGKYIIDLGAEICLVINRAFLQEHSILKPGRKTYPIEVEGLGGIKEMHLTTLCELTIDNHTFKNVPVYIFDDEFQITRYPAVKGIIGNGIMRRFNIILNYPANEIFLKRNNSFREPFNYSYTGLSIYTSGGNIFVSSVVRNSPAGKAGLMPDDQILSVDNIDSLDFEEMKEYIMTASGFLNMLVRRNGKQVEVTLRIRSILNN